MFRVRNVLAITVLGSAAFATVPFLQDMPMEAPTPQHTMLQKSVGQWEGTVTMHWPGMEGSTPATDTVTSFGPFWTISNFQSEIMGAPYQGQGMTGYDPKQKKFVGTWIDSMSSTLSLMEGSYDEAENKLVMEWEGPDMTGAMAKHRSETIHADDAYTYTMWVGGQKGMTIDMKRKGKAMEAGARMKR